MAEWLRRGLQILLSQFDSGRGLHNEMINKEIFKIALNSKNLGNIENYTHYSKVKNSNCGDEIKIYLIIKNDIVKNLKYDGHNCMYCQASASLLARYLKNKKISIIKNLYNNSESLFRNEINKLNKKFVRFNKIINKGNKSRKDCLMLPIKATLKAYKS